MAPTLSAAPHLFADQQEAFRRAPARISATGLSIGSLTVVENWESGIQERLVRQTVKQRDNVLEIGFGLGFAAREIRRMYPRQYRVVEAHPRVAARAEEMLAGLCCAEVVCDFWQNLAPPESSSRYDSIVYDSYPLRSGRAYDGSLEMSLEHIMEFLPCAGRWLATGGRLGFLDYSCEVSHHQRFVAQCTEMSLRVETFSETLAGIPADYAKQVAHIIVVTL